MRPLILRVTAARMIMTPQAFFASGKLLEVAAFGVPDERLGEAVAVMAVPSQGNEDITAKALRDAVIGTIANFKVPAEELIFVTQERLPRGATEKIQKRDIRDAISAKLGRVRWSLVAVAVW